MPGGVVDRRRVIAGVDLREQMVDVGLDSRLGDDESLVLTFGLTLLGEALVLWFRSEAGGLLISPKPNVASRRS